MPPAKGGSASSNAVTAGTTPGRAAGTQRDPVRAPVFARKPSQDQGTGQLTPAVAMPPVLKPSEAGCVTGSDPRRIG